MPKLNVEPPNAIFDDNVFLDDSSDCEAWYQLTRADLSKAPPLINHFFQKLLSNHGRQGLEKDILAVWPRLNNSGRQNLIKAAIHPLGPSCALLDDFYCDTCTTEEERHALITTMSMIAKDRGLSGYKLLFSWLY